MTCYNNSYIDIGQAYTNDLFQQTKHLHKSVFTKVLATHHTCDE